MGVISSHFPFFSSASCTVLQIYTNFSIFNVAGQSQILSLHSFLAALTIPQSLIHPASLLFSLSPSPFISLPFSVSHFHSLFLSHTDTHNTTKHIHAHIHTFSLAPSSSPPPSLSLCWVLEDLSELRGRKSTFLPHQLAKPDVENTAKGTSATDANS